MTSVCNVCNDPITGRVITALDKKWHPEHFLCMDCKQPIGDKSFHTKDGQPICKDDFAKNHTSKCKSCGKPIMDRAVTAMGETWHADHFCCKKCKKPIGDETFMQHDGRPYCKPCHVKHVAPKCEACKNPIDAKVIIAFDKKWHQECFKCGKCNKPVTDSSFAVENKKPICKACA